MKQMHKMDPEMLVKFIDEDGKTLSGAPFTVRSKKTQKDFTFKVKQSTFMGKPYLHIFVETQYLNFKYLGMFADGNIVRKVDGKRKPVDSPSAQAIAWVFRQIKSMKAKILKDNIEVFHIGKCLKCGRTLTDATSIETGFGPVCGSY